MAGSFAHAQSDLLEPPARLLKFGMPDSAVISVLARSFLAGDPNVDDVHARAVRTLGRPWRWLRPLATRYAQKFAGPVRPRHREVIRFLHNDAGFKTVIAKYGRQIFIAQWIAEPARMKPKWELPAIESTGALADWLSLTPGELDWFADLKDLNANQKLQHYRYRIMEKRSGGVRLIESPKPRLKQLQRRILSGILDRIPPHPAVHGFVKGRSIVSFATPHAGKHTVLKLDLKDFFPGSPAARVQALFRTLGYPEAVADLLGGICTNAAPASVLKQPLYTRPHLPQGAPTSPSLASLMAYRLDCRLSGLAKTAGATFTRYADDLAFSGNEDFSSVAERFSAHAAAIALEEGFHVNHRKTRIKRQGARQQLAGIVVNQKPNLRRRDLDLLKAILTNCIRHGPEAQNRESHPNFRAHLEGRIGFVEMVNSVKGRTFREVFERILWPATD